MPLLSMAEYARFLALEQRIAQIEERLATDGRQPAPLRDRNAERVADGERLREAIAEILVSHRGPREVSRKEVLRALERMDIGRKLPSLSTIGWHLREIRRQHGRIDAEHY